MMLNPLSKVWLLTRHKVARKFVNPFFDRKILDVGCGTHPVFQNCIRLDINKSCHPHIIASTDHLPLRSNFFHAVFCLEVLEHLDNWHSAIYEIHRVLQHNGKAIFSFPKSHSKIWKIVWFFYGSLIGIKHVHKKSFDSTSATALINFLFGNRALRVVNYFVLTICCVKNA